MGWGWEILPPVEAPAHIDLITMQYLTKNRRFSIFKGSSINHVDNFLEIFKPLPPLWTILVYMAYVILWNFGKAPSPPLAMSTWLMNDPFRYKIFPKQLNSFMFYYGMCMTDNIFRTSKIFYEVTPIWKTMTSN